MIDFQPHQSQIDFQASGPQKQPFEGTHFSDDPIEGGVLHGSRRGSSPDASDALRLHLGEGAVPASHVYERNSVGHPHITSRKFAHKVSGNYAIADIDKNDTWKSALNSAYQQNLAAGQDKHTAFASALNSAERAIHEAGWDGYRSSSHKGSVVLFGDTPINADVKSVKTA